MRFWQLFEFRQSLRSRWFLFSFSVIFLVQLILSFYCFREAQLLSSKPIVNVDLSGYYYMAFIAKRFLAESGRIWGFDPYFMAGYPADFVWNTMLPLQVICAIFWWVEIGLVIKWFVFLNFLLAPFLVYFGLKNFGLGRGSALAGTGLGMCYFWAGENAIVAHWGMVAGWLSLNFFPFTISWLYRYLRVRDKTSFLWLLISVPVALLYHKTFAIAVAVPGLILVLLFIRKMDLKCWISLLGVGVFAFLLNSFWILPFLKFLHLKIEDPLTSFFQNYDWLRFFKDIFPLEPFFGISVLRLLILAFGIIGLARIWQEKVEGRRLFWFILLVWVLFFPFIYFGSQVAFLRHFQPYRYLPFIYFLLIPASGVGMSKIKAWFSLRSAWLSRCSGLGLGVVLLVILFGLPNYMTWFVLQPLTSRLPGKVLALEGWIKNNTDLSARIMIEDIIRWDKQAPYGASRYACLLAVWGPRYLVGGPVPNAFIKHHYVTFQEGHFLDREIGSFSDAELKEAVELYNIKWAIVWTQESKERFGRCGFAQKMAEFEDLEVYEFDIKADWFLVGEGELKVMDYDRIELSKLKPDGGKVVLKVHYLDDFHSEPEVKIFCYKEGGDPVGFLGLENPPSELRLKYGK